MNTAPAPRLDSVQCLHPGGLHRMAWAEWGDPANPRVLVCAHGLARQGRDFDTLAQAMAGEYRVVCPDVVGRGKSDWLPDAMGYGIPTYVADMVTLLARLDALGLIEAGLGWGWLRAAGLQGLRLCKQGVWMGALECGRMVGHREQAQYIDRDQGNGRLALGGSCVRIHKHVLIFHNGVCGEVRKR